MKEDHVERSLSMNALQYAASHLLYVAGVRKQDIAFDGLTALAGGISVRFCAPRENAAGDILQGAAVPTTVSSADGQLCIPLFDGSALCHWEAGVLVLDADVLTISFLLMTAYEDTLEGPRDRYDRLSYRNSILAKYNLIEFPLIDEYAMLLRRELQGAGAALSVHRPRIVPTHDVDNLWRFRSPLSAAKSIIGGDLLHRRAPAIAADSLRSVMHSRCMPELDPLNQACIRLCTLSAEHGLTSEFYFLGYGRDETDWRYDVQQPFVHQLMEDLERQGAVIGFHGGMGSYTHAGCYAAQKQRVDHAYGKTTACGRQHYLLFSALETPAILENAGLHADASLGFFDREGFRCGTCHPYPLYDLKRDCPLSVMERPLLLMDGTLREYRGLSIDEAMVSARGLLERVLAVGGEFVILWHNGSVHREWTPWFHQLYVPFIQYAASCCK